MMACQPTTLSHRLSFRACSTSLICKLGACHIVEEVTHRLHQLDPPMRSNPLPNDTDSSLSEFRREVVWSHSPSPASAYFTLIAIYTKRMLMSAATIDKTIARIPSAILNLPNSLLFHIENNCTSE